MLIWRISLAPRVAITIVNFDPPLLELHPNQHFVKGFYYFTHLVGASGFDYHSKLRPSTPRAASKSALP